MAENAFGIVFAGFVETIHVELPDEAVNFFMPEVFGQHNFLKLVDVLDDEILASSAPEYYFGVVLILNNKSDTFKISKVLATNPAISGSWPCDISS